MSEVSGKEAAWPERGVGSREEMDGKRFKMKPKREQDQQPWSAAHDTKL